jgi:anaphase-promoting complex subunit 8
MWCALAGCFESVGCVQEAIDCYVRASSGGQSDGAALHKLATLYRGLGDLDTAAGCYLRNLERRDAEGAEGQETVDALLFLAAHARDGGRLDQAEMYCARLLELSVPEKEDAKALLREIRSLQDRGSAAGGGFGGFGGAGLGGRSTGMSLAGDRSSLFAHVDDDDDDDDGGGGTNNVLQ